MDPTELLGRFGSQTVLVPGDVFLDEFLSGDCSRLSPEAPVPVLKVDEGKPHVHVNGSEYGADCIEAPLVKANGGRIHIIEKIPALSTSEILARVRALE